MIKKLLHCLFHDRKRIYIALLYRFSRLFPDKIYLKLLFKLKLGYTLNLEKPQTYNEKLQWIKLYDRNPMYSMLVDKYEVKKYVSAIIGEKYVIPTIGVWDSVDNIDFNSLPQQFVLKTTHGGGSCGVVICKDKTVLDVEACKKKLTKAMKQNIFLHHREWPYKNVVPRIIAEEYMADCNGELNDYKYYCFNGEPKMFFIATDRRTEVHFDYFDMNFNHLPFEQGGPNSPKELQRPQNMEEMMNIAAKLSQNIPHVRVDMYNVDGRIYFGELTFFDSSGFAVFNPQEWDYILGSWINLPMS